MGRFIARYGKAPTKRFNKNKDGLFTDMNFWAENGKKYLNVTHAVEPKNEICSKMVI
jgi:hypothetical protein